MILTQTDRTDSEPPSERELLDAAILRVRELLPPGWSLEEMPPPLSPESDGAIRISAPDGTAGTLLIEAKSLMNPKDALFAVDQMTRFGSGMDAFMMVARYLSPRAREVLEGSNVSYADFTGNTFVTMGAPGLAIRAQGKDRDPFRGPDRRTSSLKGGPAAKVVRALIDYRPPWKMRELAEAAGTSLASTSRTIDFLDREALVSRNELGSVVDVDWPGIIRRWARDYELARKRDRVTRLIAPRGLDVAISGLTGADLTYALSGSLAARPLAPYADPKLGLIYTRGTKELQAILGASLAQARANIVVIEPADDLPFIRTDISTGLRMVAPSQAAVDLLSGPGRNPEEGQALLEWMEANEAEWRSR